MGYLVVDKIDTKIIHVRTISNILYSCGLENNNDIKAID